MTQSRRISWIAGALALALSWPVSAQPTPTTATGEVKASPSGAAEADKPVDALSAEERIRRATVPPPGKACAPDPLEAERAKLDARHARNLDFVALANQTVEQASEIASREWANQRARLHAKSKADMEAWLAERDQMRKGWAVANPCRSQKPQGHAVHSPTGSKRRTPLRDLIFASRPAVGSSESGEGSGTDKSRDLAVMLLGLSAYGPAADRGFECGPDGQWLRTSRFFSKVRGELGGDRNGTRLLLAIASNVPTICFVEALFQRDGAEVGRKTISFEGWGMQGGIVKEAELGQGIDPFRDELVLTSVCVPRLIWRRPGSPPGVLQ